MAKSIKFLLVILLLSPFLINSSGAQENIPVEVDDISNPALDLTLTRLPQEYPSKNITYELRVHSLIDSDKVSVTWSAPETLYKIIGSEQDTISVRNNQSTITTKSFAPISEELVSAKQLEIGVVVNGYVADQNYLSSTVGSFVVDKSYEVVPIDEEYSNAKLIDQVIKISLIILALILFIALLIFAIRKFIKYLNTD